MLPKMQFHIPFTFAPTNVLKKRASFIKIRPKSGKDSKLKHYLENADAGLTPQEYFAICIRSFMFSATLTFFLTSILFVLLKLKSPLLLSLIVTLGSSFFIISMQLVYPRLYCTRKQKNIEKNLIPALTDMLVQLNSGIPLFSIMVNISSSEYGALSGEFNKAVKKISAGYPEVEVLEELGEKNISSFFRRTLWQISNGLKAGSDVSIVIRESIKILSEEQLLQIQNYGNKLNPIVMFYMLSSVILPALAITFLTIISSLVNLSQNASTVMFVGMAVFVILLQITFLGTIKSIRPSLL